MLKNNVMISKHIYSCSISLKNTSPGNKYLKNKINNYFKLALGSKLDKNNKPVLLTMT